MGLGCGGFPKPDTRHSTTFRQAASRKHCATQISTGSQSSCGESKVTMNMLRRARRVLVLLAGSLEGNLPVVEASAQLAISFLSSSLHGLPM